MEPKPRIVELLNDVLTAELTAISQYFLGAKMLDDWGFSRLAHWFREASMEEMRDAEQITDRILLLNGMPNYQRLEPLRIGEAPIEHLRAALDLELDAVKRLNEAVAVSVDAGDNGARALFEEVLSGEEEHVDWLETQLDAVDRLGETAYLAQQLHHDD
jgi:bacterioferritin